MSCLTKKLQCMQVHQPTILFIAGTGRSGSTLLERLLALYPGAFALGEIRDLWRMLEDRYLCGCGKRVKECGFWVEVVRSAFGAGWASVLAQMAKVCHRVLRFWMAPSVIIEARSLSEYRSFLRELYLSVARVARTELLVDSSKDAHYGLTLAAALRGRADVRVIHLVRDSRAVAYSRLRAKVVPWDSQPSYLQRASVVKSSVLYARQHSLTRILQTRVPQSCVVRYEDLVRRPEPTVRSLSAVGLDPVPLLRALDGETVSNEPDHALFGNPIRFQHGRIQLREDAEWRTRMRPRDKLITTVLTAPWLMRYGYLGPAKSAAERTKC